MAIAVVIDVVIDVVIAEEVMTNLFIILGALLIGLIAMVQIAKWLAPSSNPQTLHKLSRWVMPLLFAVLVLQLLAHYLGN